MLSLSQIVEFSEEAGRRARSRKLTPFVPFDKNTVNKYFAHPDGSFFPNLGTYRPVGWDLVDHALVDKTGWGYESEPAWTIRHLHEFILQTIDDGQRFGWAIIEEGEFQLVIGWFERNADWRDGNPNPFSHWYDCDEGYNEV